MGAKNLMEELVELASKNEKTGLVLLDALIADALDEDRMATQAEMAELRENAKARQKPALTLVFKDL